MMLRSRGPVCFFYSSQTSLAPSSGAMWVMPGRQEADGDGVGCVAAAFLVASYLSGSEICMHMVDQTSLRLTRLLLLLLLLLFRLPA